MRERAIDLLWEWGWFIGEDKDAEKRRGRRALGKYAVNPAVHVEMADRAAFARTERAEKYRLLRERVGVE
jgi:hypothetical protein